MKNFFVSNKLYFLTAFIVLTYIGGIYWFVYIRKLELKDFISILTIILGWVVVLIVGLIHVRQTRGDNRSAKKEEIRKSLEINAFREINIATTNFYSIISDIAVMFISMPGNLRLHKQFPQIFKFNKTEIDLQINQKIVNLLNGLTQFVMTIEAHEIAVIKFHHYRIFIQQRIDDARESLKKFQSYFINIKTPILIDDAGMEDLNLRCDKIHNEISNISSYLHDYRIELMNSFLTDIFDTSIPERKPPDKKYKTLKEVAIKDEVEKEERQRTEKALKGKTTAS